MSEPGEMVVSGSAKGVGETLDGLREGIFGLEVVMVVPRDDSVAAELVFAPMVTPAGEAIFKELPDLIAPVIGTGQRPETMVHLVGDESWAILVEPIKVQGGIVIGGVVVARRGSQWISQEREVIRRFADLIGQVQKFMHRESSLLHQQRLDDLVSLIASQLMPVTAARRREALTWTVEMLGKFVGADVAFLRRNDHARGMSVLVAEWPARENVPDPDPLGEVSFDSDPIFAMTRDLKEPSYMGGPDNPEDYQERVEQGSGVRLVNGAGVPLLRGDTTWGVLAFLHFGLHRWLPEEINALQAVASMLMQLEARIEAETMTEHIAFHDELTGLPNRRALNRELDARLSKGRSTAVLVVDLDRFKVMNDFLGHASGDMLLVSLADAFREDLGPGDFAARLGGDEFVILMDDGDEDGVRARAEGLLRTVSTIVEISGQQIRHTASVGIAITSSKSVEGLDPLACADVAMYEAKRLGRNQVRIYDEKLRAVVNERFKLEAALTKGIAEGQLRLYFQPEIDLHTGELLAAEALLRWEHPTRGLLHATDFIRIAEESGLVVEIGRWVFDEACRQLSVWRQEFPERELTMRVNMSPAEFMTDDLMTHVKEVMANYGVNGEDLCIEITEHAVVHEPARAISILEELEDIGIDIAIDDFGTGFASMSELKYLPADALKLDISFVRGITHDPYDSAIVESIIHLGRSLNLAVVAEGVESREIAKKLLALGCDRGQGFFIARPMPAEEFTEHLRHGTIRVDGREWVDMIATAGAESR